MSGDRDFNAGVFFAAQFIALDHDEPTLAAEILRQAGFDREMAICEAARSGYEYERTKEFLDEEFK